MIEVISLTRHVGAEIRGLDLRDEIDTATASQLYAVRVLGSSGRVRIMRYDSVRVKWVQL